MKVLNAFRHHGLFRLRARGGGLVSESAQRLSTSRIISDTSMGDIMHATTRRCSTPFGITDYFGLLPVCDHLDYLGAQRLSASRIISELHSGDDAPTAQECSTPFGITDYFGQGLGHRLGNRRQCSTPFGITDYFGLPRHPHRPVAPGSVLNAFRHHGLFRMCSRVLSCSSEPCAQRLSASRIISARRCAPRLASARRCSTPFGITDYFGGGLSTRPTMPLISAQRLSASRIISAARAIAPKLTPYCAQRLSASRIISGGARRENDQIQGQVLNAFRHHGLFRAALNRYRRSPA